MQTPLAEQPDQTLRLVVLESRPRWEPELKRRFSGEPIRVGGCRTFADLDLRTCGAERSLALVDLTMRLPARTGPDTADRVTPDADPLPAGDPTGMMAAAGALLRWLAQLDAERRMVPVLVMAGAPLAPLEWSVRELGVVAWCDESVVGRRVAALCRKLGNMAPDPTCRASRIRPPGSTGTRERPSP